MSRQPGGTGGLLETLGVSMQQASPEAQLVEAFGVLPGSALQAAALMQLPGAPAHWHSGRVAPASVGIRPPSPPAASTASAGSAGASGGSASGASASRAA